VRAGRLHQARLLGERLRRREVAHHEEPGDVHPELAGGGDVLRGDVGFGAVRRHPHGARAQVVGAAQLGVGAEPRQQQCREPGALEDVGRGLDPLPVGVAARPVVEVAAGQAVTVRHLDGVDTGRVERRHDLADTARRDAVPDGVHAVPEGDVLQEDPRAHRTTSSRRERSAILSATRSAADVMMSRFPA
jgi:hypothetical protein